MTADAPRANKFASAVRMFTRLVGVQEDTIPAIEAHTLELLAALEAHFAEHAFLLGARPSLADCALMGPCYGHLYLDIVPGRLLRETRAAHVPLDRAHEPSRSGLLRRLAAGRRAAADAAPVVALIGRTRCR